MQKESRYRSSDNQELDHSESDVPTDNLGNATQSDLLVSNNSSPTSSTSGFVDSSNSDGVMSERIKHIASSIYSEFEAMIEAYGLPVVQRLMPLVVGVLENLDELYKDQIDYHAEVDQLREQNAYLYRELDSEKHRRKQSELRLLQTEEAFDEERKTIDSKLETMTTSFKQAQMKYQTTRDQVSRLEAKESDWKKESLHLHERINELLRANVDLTERLKFSNRIDSQPFTKSAASSLLQGTLRTATLADHNLSDGVTVPRPTQECMFDATSSGFGFDEMPTCEHDDGAVSLDEELALPEDSGALLTEVDLGEFAGMRKEIDTLITENMELVETKNALNVVKDDLLAKVDSLSCENTSLHEALSHLTQLRANLLTELSSTDQLLNEARTELVELRDKLAKKSSASEESGKSGSMRRKRFTQAEMARVLSERNQYKERLMELQEAVRLSETLRAGQKGHPDLLGEPICNNSSTPISSVSSTRPLQSLQALFSRLRKLAS